MKKCNYCGGVLEDNANFCEFCGANQIKENQVNQQNQSIQEGQNNNPFNPAERVWGMGWYKFLINFWLIFMAVVLFIVSLPYLTGLIRDDLLGNTAKEFYFYYPLLKGLDVTYGILQILVGVFAIVTRVYLAKFKKQGPNLFLIFIIVNCAIDFLFILFEAIILKDAALISDLLFNIAWCLVVFFSFRKYFNNRKHLFVN